MISKCIKIVHMGDSITFGQYVDPNFRWTTLVADRLRSTLSGSVAIESINVGISGETTRQGLERFPRDVQEHRPDIMTLEFGLNDCNCWQTDGGHPRVSPAAFQANLLEMIARARLFGCRRIVLANNHRTLRRAPMSSGETFESANERYSQIMAGVAREAQVDFCDIRRAFDPFDDEQLAAQLLPAPDILHLSIEGNRYYSDTIFPHVLRAVTHCLAERKPTKEVA